MFGFFCFFFFKKIRINVCVCVCVCVFPLCVFVGAVRFVMLGVYDFLHFCLFCFVGWYVLAIFALELFL